MIRANSSGSGNSLRSSRNSKRRSRLRWEAALRIEPLESRVLLSAYTVTDLGANLSATGINDSGQVSGYEPALMPSTLFVTSDSGTIGEYTTSGATVNASLVSGLPHLRGIAVSGSDLFVASYNADSIGEYTTSGATINGSLVSGVSNANGIAASGSDLFVADNGAGTIGEYTTSGTTVNASLVSGSGDPIGVAVSGPDLFITNGATGTIGEYTTSGATVNASLVSGLAYPFAIAVSGSDLFVANDASGTIGEYTVSGATVNASLVSGLHSPQGIAVSGSDLFVANFGADTIGEYTTSGATVDASLISGLGNPSGIAVVASPPQGFIYSDATVTTLNTAAATAISPTGVVVGNGYYYDGSVHSAPLANNPGGINANGLVADSSGSFPNFHPNIYDITAGQDVTPATLSGLNADTSGINAAGDVVGVMNGDSSSYIYANGTLTTGLPGVGSAINDSDAVTGYTTANQAYIYQNGQVQNIGAQAGGTSFAFSINDAGQVVGQWNGGGFVYNNGVMTDLNTLVPAGTPHLGSGVAINNLGQIICNGDGGVHAFLLTPIAVSATSLSAPAVSATFDATALLSATLTSSGTPVPNQPVSFSIDSTVAGSAITDQNGIAILPYALGNLALGNHAVVATFTGDAGYTASSANSTLTVTDQNIQGLVWVDFNDDGNVDFGEGGIGGIAITLTNSVGQIVAQTTTDANGLYTFNHIPPDTYTIAQGATPAGYLEGKDSLGTITDLSGNPIAGGVGNSSVQDVFSQVVIGADQNAINYNFGEQPAPGSVVSRGQAAGIGFWQNKNGQALILNFASIGSWLADSLPQTFGGLANSSPQQVATLYQQQFVLKDKLDAQFMATALNVYATDQSLGGPAAAYYGFATNQYGLGDSTWNIGSDGAAFNVSNNTTLTVMQILQDWDQQANKTSTSLRKLALDVFGGINGKGGL